MPIRLSTSLRSSMLGDYGLRTMMQYGYIEVYTGGQPDSADGPPTGGLLAVITQNGDTFVPGTITGGLQFGIDTMGKLVKQGTWQLKGVATGTAGWWRWKWNGGVSQDIDSDEISLFYPRVDGAVGQSLVLDNTAITPATQVNITSFSMDFLEA